MAPRAGVAYAPPVLFVSLRDLQWRKRRVFIGVLAAGLVFALALVITGISQSFRNEVKRTVDAVGADEWVVSEKVNGPFTASTLISSGLAATIASQPGVEQAAPVVLLRNTLKKSPTSAVRDVGMIGAEPGRVGSPAVDDGRPLQADGEAVVDKALDIGVGKVVAIAGTDFRVVGRTDGVTYFAGIPAVFITAEDAQKLSFAGAPLASAIVLRGNLAQPPPGTHVVTNDTVRNDLRRPMENGAGTIDMMRILLWIVAAGIIGSILYLQAIERTRDFAVFKATGITGRSLAFGLAVQAVVLALLATVVAIILSLILAPFMPIRVELPLSAFILLPVVAIIISIVASLGGLRRAVSVDPALAFG